MSAVQTQGYDIHVAFDQPGFQPRHLINGLNAGLLTIKGSQVFDQDGRVIASIIEKHPDAGEARLSDFSFVSELE